jgi:hypothetical protein
MWKLQNDIKYNLKYVCNFGKSNCDYDYDVVINGAWEGIRENIKDATFEAFIVVMFQVCNSYRIQANSMEISEICKT